MGTGTVNHIEIKIQLTETVAGICPSWRRNSGKGQPGVGSFPVNPYPDFRAKSTQRNDEGGYSDTRPGRKLS